MRRITGVARSTRTGWVKRGIIEEPEKGPFLERHVVETSVFARLAGKLDAGVAQAAWLDAGKGVLAASLSGCPGELDRLDVLVNTQTAALAIVSSDEEVGRIVRRDEGQAQALLQLARCVNQTREAFWRYARAIAADRGTQRGAAAARRSRKSA